jgi:NarL family two-component system response regulator YdfI
LTATARVLVVEDDRRTAQAICAILRSADYSAIEIAHSGARAEVLFQTFDPDLVLMDLGLPDRDGADLIRAARASRFLKPILVLTSATTEDRILAALRAGADGYLFKDDLDPRLTGALRELVSGGAPLSPGAAAAVLRQVRLGSHGIESPDRSILPALTPKERSVLEELATGAGYTEIAGSLKIELNTVRTHIRSLYAKLGVENRAEAVNLGWALGLLRRP